MCQEWCVSSQCSGFQKLCLCSVTQLHISFAFFFFGNKEKYANIVFTLQLPYALMMHEWVVPLSLMIWLKMIDKQQRCLAVKYLSFIPPLFKVTLCFWLRDKLNNLCLLSKTCSYHFLLLEMTLSNWFCFQKQFPIWLETWLGKGTKALWAWQLLMFRATQGAAPTCPFAQPPLYPCKNCSGAKLALLFSLRHFLPALLILCIYLPGEETIFSLFLPWKLSFWTALF